MKLFLATLFTVLCLAGCNEYVKKNLGNAGVKYTIWYDCGFACSDIYYATDIEIYETRVKFKTIGGVTKYISLDRCVITEVLEEK